MKRIAGMTIGRGRRGRLGWVAVLALMAAGSVTATYGGAAAETASTPAVNEAKPIVLAGRWSGKRYGYGMREDGPKCRSAGCVITFDIVACPTGWCGIRVADDKSCGAVGLHLASDAKSENPNRFAGKLELAQGTAPYVVEAWYGPGDDSDKPHLSFVGDTGTELLMMRRSFPFEAHLERVADATCTLEKATS